MSRKHGGAGPVLPVSSGTRRRVRLPPPPSSPTATLTSKLCFLLLGAILAIIIREALESVRLIDVRVRKYLQSFLKKIFF